MNHQKYYLKKTISLCMILCMLFSLGLGIKQLQSLKIEKQDFRHQVSNVVEWESMSVPVISSMRLTMMRQEVKIDRIEILRILLQSIQVQLCYLLYMRVILIGFVISCFIRIISYIHHKDGPKGFISPI